MDLTPQEETGANPQAYKYNPFNQSGNYYSELLNKFTTLTLKTLLKFF